MSTSSALGRHRAVPVHTSPLAAISKAVSSNAGSVGRQTAVIVAASGLVLTAGLPANGADSAKREVQATTVLSAAASGSAVVTAPATADISFERSAVSATPAPVATASVAETTAVEETVVEETVVEAEGAAAADAEIALHAVPAVGVEATPQATPAVVPAAAPVEAAPAKEKPKADVESSGVGAALVGSAYAQLGATQDCTILVEVALRSIGKSVGDLGPEQFYAYGDVVSSPAPGDLVIRPGHIGIYVGNGQVISSGMNGVNATLLHPLSDLPGSSFVRVR